MPITVLCLNIRAGGGKRAPDLCRYLDERNPEIVVLTEWRDNPSGRPFAEWAAKRSMHHANLTDGGTANGVFIASRLRFATQSMTPKTKGAGVLLLGQFDAFALLACYFPSFSGKEPFYATCSAIADTHGSRPFLLIGDLNTGNQILDRSEKGVRYASADRFDALSSKHGLCDLWRRTHGPGAREWSWLSHRQNGFRIDHAFANKAFVERMRPDCYYDHSPRENRWSDHSALVAKATR